MKYENNKTRTLTVTAILSALILVLAFTPLGYLKIGVLSITFLTVPVVIGAVMEGPGVGTVLGAVFGLTSFAQCFGLDPVGTLLFSVNPWLTFLMCVLPRVLVGFLSGLIFRFTDKLPIRNSVAAGITCFSGAFLNTLLFMTAFVANCYVALSVKAALFDTSALTALLGTDNLWVVLGAVVSLNSAVEAAVCTLIGTAVCSVLMKVYK